MFRLIERMVRGGEQLVRRTHARVVRGNASTHSQSATSIHIFLCQHRAYAVGKNQRTFGIGRSQDRDELLTAETGGEVHPARQDFKNLTKRRQCRIAHRMAVGVVVLLEVIQVEEHE